MNAIASVPNFEVSGLAQTGTILGMSPGQTASTAAPGAFSFDTLLGIAQSLGSLEQALTQATPATQLQTVPKAQQSAQTANSLLPQNEEASVQAQVQLCFQPQAAAQATVATEPEQIQTDQRIQTCEQDNGADKDATKISLHVLLGGLLAAPASAVTPQTPQAATPGEKTTQGGVEQNLLSQTGKNADSQGKRTSGQTLVTAQGEASSSNKTYTWNVQELSQNLRDALASLQPQQPAQTTEASANGQQAKISGLGTQPFMEADGAQQTVLTSTVKTTTKGTAGSLADPLAGALSTTTATAQWEAQPVQDTQGNTRMPDMIEQVRQISDFLAERTQGSIQMNDKGVEANLRLYPPDMGGVRVQLTVSNDSSVQATFVTERAETAQLLDQHMNQFRQALSQHGLRVDSLQVSVQTSATTGNPADNSSGQQTLQQQHNGANDGQRRQAANQEDASNGQQHSRSKNRQQQQQQQS